MRASKKARRAARSLLRMCVVDGVFDDGRARQIVQGVVASGRRGAMSILADFRRLVRLDRARNTALIASATPLAANLREKIHRDLVKAHGGNLEAAFEEDPALIGGLRIKVGSSVYDGSVRARLMSLKERL
jgi:F-type H+-transporting ATPase subunit delta